MASTDSFVTGNNVLSKCPKVSFVVLILLYLVVERAVGRFLGHRVFLLIFHTNENDRVDVYTDELPSLKDVYVHLHARTHTYRV